MYPIKLNGQIRDKLLFRKGFDSLLVKQIQVLEKVASLEVSRQNQNLSNDSCLETYLKSLAK